MPEDNWIFPPDLPEEMQAAIKAMLDRQRMAQTVSRQSISRFYQELSEEQLETLNFILGVITNNPAAGSFYEGFTRAILAQKYDKWAGWNDDPDLSVSVSTDQNGIHLEVVAQPPLEKKDTPNTVAEAFRARDEAHHKNDPTADLKEYNVALADEYPKVVCNACGMVYQSLKDRMIKRDCHGCVEKAKWG